MKKLLILLFAMSLVLFSAVAAYGFNSPTVTEGQFDVMAMFVSAGGLMVGGEYGITPELAVTLEAGPFTKVGVIYELKSNLALTGGMGSGVYVGVIGSTPVGKNLLGIGELDLEILSNQVAIMYEAGVRYALKGRWDLRGGVVGVMVGGMNVMGLGIGVGYRFNI